MKTLLLTILLIPTIANATNCEEMGLYAFALVNCPQYDPKMDLTVPLCKQEKYKHLAFMDSRCYVEEKIDWSCMEWDCPAPYEHKMVEPISGKVKYKHGSWEEVDWNYRACRQTLGEK